MLISVIVLSLVVSVVTAQAGTSGNPNGPLIANSNPAPSTSPQQEGVFVALWKAFFGGIGDFGDIGTFSDFMSDKFGLTGVSATTTTGEFIGFFLIMFLVFMLVYDISTMLPFFNNGWMRTGVSGAFTFLAFLFFDITQIRYLTSTYQAVGITLVAILPFLVIMAFTSKLDKRAEDETKPSYQYMSSAIWAFFGVYLLLKWNTLRNTSGDTTILFAYMIFALVALIQVFLHGSIFSFLNRWRLRGARKLGVKKGEKNQVRALRNRVQELNEAMRNPENASDVDKLQTLQKEKDELEKSIRFLEKQ